MNFFKRLFGRSGKMKFSGGAEDNAVILLKQSEMTQIAHKIKTEPESSQASVAPQPTLTDNDKKFFPVTADKFTGLVKEAYSFLESEYGFEYVTTRDIPRIIEIRYRRGDFMIIVIYSRANDYIEVDICDHADILEPPVYHKYCTMLMSLIHDKNPQLDYMVYDAIMPKVIPLEDSVKQTAALLKEYAHEILSGTNTIDENKK